MPEKNLETFYVNLNKRDKGLAQIVTGRETAMEMMRKHILDRRREYNENQGSTVEPSLEQEEKRRAMCFLEGKYDQVMFYHVQYEKYTYPPAHPSAGKEYSSVVYYRCDIEKVEVK